MSIDPEMFHDHLDKCARCRNQPFNLCPVGHALLTGTQKPVTMKTDDKTWDAEDAIMSAVEKIHGHGSVEDADSVVKEAMRQLWLDPEVVAKVRRMTADFIWPSTHEMGRHGGPCLACKRSNFGKCRSHR